MFLTDIFEAVKCDLATAKAVRDMGKAEAAMYKDVKASDVQKVFDAAAYQNQTGCDWAFAIEKFFCEKKLNLGHFEAIKKIIATADIADQNKQALYANIAATLSLDNSGNDATSVLRKAQYTDADILDFRDWASAHKEAVAQIQKVFEGESGEYQGADWTPMSPAAVAKAAPVATAQVQPQNPAVGMNFGPLVQPAV